MKNAPYVITISRQLGSGGSYIGQCIAKRMGIYYMDREILSEVARNYSFPLSVMYLRHSLKLLIKLQMKDLPLLLAEGQVAGHAWTDASNYQLCINSGMIGLDNAVNIIINYIKDKFGVREIHPEMG